MAIVDPVLDYFIQIPMDSKNILHFLSQWGFQTSRVQNPNGTLKYLLFCRKEFPENTVQFSEDPEGVEHFVSTYSHTFYFLLTENEMGFIKHGPKSRRGVFISKMDENGFFSARESEHSGNLSKSFEETHHVKFRVDIKTVEHQLDQPHVQMIFQNFVVGKRLFDLSTLLERLYIGK